MKKFIEKLKERGDFEAMKKSCILVSSMKGGKEVKVPADAVEGMINVTIQEDEDLKELFCDEAFDLAIQVVVEAIKEEVKDVKIEPVTSQSVISELLGILGTVTDALKNMNDDLK